MVEHKRTSENTVNNSRPMISCIIISLKGFCMGAADVVPGVSGGTMALILGIYEELIRSIRSFDIKFLKLLFNGKLQEALACFSWQFLLFLAAGILIAIFSLAKILGWLLETHPVLIWSFFFGLILASLVLVSRQLEKWTLPMVIAMIIGALGAYTLVGLIPVSTPEEPWFLFLSGAIAICAMILPGISGSFILVLLGKYHYVLDAVNNRDFFTLLIVALGTGVGLMTFVRLLNWLLKRYHDLTMAILTGLMLGSLRKIWPWKISIEIPIPEGGVSHASQLNIFPQSFNQELLTALLLMVFGIILVFSMNYFARQKTDI